MHEWQRRAGNECGDSTLSIIVDAGDKISVAEDVVLL